MLFLFLLQNQRTRRQNRSCLGGWYQWEEADVVKGCRSVNTQCKYCVHIYVNGKMRPVETIPGMGEGRIKENGRGGEFKYDIFVIL
jgi:hypothetical protein